MKNRKKKFSIFNFFILFVLMAYMMVSMPYLPSTILALASKATESKIQNYSAPASTESVKYGAEDVEVTGNTEETASNAGIVVDRGTVGLNTPNDLPKAEEISGNWLDEFLYKDSDPENQEETNKRTLADLMNDFTKEQGNLFKDASGNILRQQDTYDISNEKEFSFLSAYINTRGNVLTDTYFVLNNKTFRLANNIDLKGKEWTPFYAFDFRQNITMNFDGDSHYIDHVYIKNTDEADATEKTKAQTASIFGAWPNGKISNLIVKNSSIANYLSAAIIAFDPWKVYAKNFENIEIKNSKLFSTGTEVYGISGCADNIIDCYMENCEIIGSDISSELFVVDTTHDENFNQNGNTYAVAGFGMSNVLSKSSKDFVGIKNCKIGFETVNDQYAQLTVSRTRTVYVAGLIRNTRSTSIISMYSYSGATVENCDVYCNIEIKDAKKDSVLDETHYTFTDIIYVAGGVLALSQNNLSQENKDMLVKNSKISLDYKYLPSEGQEQNKNQIYALDRGIVLGYGMGNSRRTVDGNVYKNITVENCEITANAKEDIKNCNNTFDARNIRLVTSIAGLIRMETEQSTKVDDCKVLNSKIVADTECDCVDNNQYYITGEARCFGLVSYQSYTAVINHSSVENCLISAKSDVNAGTDTEETNYNNRSWNYANVWGIGNGCFNDVTLSNCKLVAEAIDNDRNTDIDKDYTTGNVLVIGLGAPVANFAENLNANNTVKNCDFNAKSTHQLCYVSAMYYEDKSQFNTVIDNSKVLDSTITIENNSTNPTNSGMLFFNDTSTQFKLEIKNSKVNNVKLIEKSYQNVIDSAFVISKSVISGGIYLHDNEVDKVEMLSDESTFHAGYGIFSGFFENDARSTTQYVIENNVVKNTTQKIITNLTNNTSGRRLFSIGLVYSESSPGNGALQTVKNNTLSNINIFNQVSGNNGKGNSCYQVGCVYDSSGAQVSLENNTMENSTLYGLSNDANYVESFGIAYVSRDYGSTINECYVNNCSIKAEFQNGGFNKSTDSVLAYGIAAGYYNYITNCVMGSGEVIASNDIGGAWASGIGYTRGFETNEETVSTIWPLDDVKISDCVNYATVGAYTKNNSSSTNASGIGRAFTIENCTNYGNITGTKAGGITNGIYQSYDSRYTNRSVPLTIRNCVNAGNICRPDNGSTAYVGGLIGWYDMGYPENFKIKIENNISIGGVYSHQDSDGNYSQVLSVSTYLGMIFGYFYWNNSDNCDVHNISIRNNYMLVEKDGVNSGLWRDDEYYDTKFYATPNTPVPNVISTIEGVFTAGLSDLEKNSNKLKEISDNSLDIGATENSNNYISSNYTKDTFKTKPEYGSYAADNGWKEWSMDSGNVPQVENTRKRLVAGYSLGNYKGILPNVHIVSADDDNNFKFNLSGTTVGDQDIISQVGVSLTKWILGDVEHDPNEQITVNTASKTLTFVAKVNFTEYTLNLEEVADISYTYTCNDSTLQSNKKFTIAVSEASIVANYVHVGGDQTLTAIDWQVLLPNTSSEYVTIYRQAMVTETSSTLNLKEYITTEFLENYVKTADSNYTVTIKAVPYTEKLFKVDVTSVSDEGNNHFSVQALCGGVDVVNNGAQQNLDVSIVINIDPFYEITDVSFEGGSGVQGADKAHWTIQSISSDVNIKVTVQKIKYDFNIEIQNLQGVTLDESLLSTLIDSDSLNMTMSVDSSIPNLVANTNIQGYRFVGWKLLGMDNYITDENGTISDDYVISSEDFSRYLVGGKFMLLVIFQRQYVVDITLNNRYDESFASMYELHYTDENGDDQVKTNLVDGELSADGSYIIDENTFIQLVIKPNKRVMVVPPADEQYGNNTIYIYLTKDKQINIDFEVRPLEMNLSAINVMSPNDVDTSDTNISANHLITAIQFKVFSDSGDFLYDNTSSSQLNIANKVQFGYDFDLLKNTMFRFITLRLYNVSTLTFDDVSLNSDIIVDNEFFDKYVDEDGNVLVSMKVIKQYNANITGQNLTTSDGFELGSYDVQVLDEYSQPASQDRFTFNSNTNTYVLDNGLILKITANTTNKYARFDGFTGLYDDEENEQIAMVNIDESRAVTVRFAKAIYTMNISYNAGVGGILDFTKSFGLGDTISISYTPKKNFEIKSWNINGKTLEDLGATQSGNTISMYVNEALLDSLLESGESEILNLEANINTMMSATILYGIIGGGALILILFAIVLILVLRANKLKKQKEENERKLNDIARKFNISDMIKDLRNNQ